MANKMVLKKFESEQSTCCVHFNNTRQMAFSNMRIVAGTVISAVGDMVVNNDRPGGRSGAGKSFVGNNLTVTEDDATVVGNGCNVTGARCKVTGNRSRVNGNGCIVTGYLCIVTGNGCRVIGNDSDVNGDGCIVDGNECIVTGNECKVSGTRSHVNGNGCTITGDECVVQGDDCVVCGARAFTTGNGNVVNGVHVSSTGETRVDVRGSHHSGPARRDTRPSPSVRGAPDLFFALGGVTVVNNGGGDAVRIPHEAPVRATVFDTSQPDIELGDEDAELNPDRACTVCMSNSRAVVAIPCLHSTLCHTCCDKLKDSGARDIATGLHLCPQCRRGVERFGHIYN